MSVHEQIKEDLKEAMKQKDKTRRQVLRDILSAFTNHQVEEGEQPDERLGDEEAIAVINKLAKQRKDSIKQFKEGGRDDLVSQEKEELEILEEYLPEQLDDEQIRTIVEEKMETLDINDPSEFGKLMGTVMEEVGAQADGDTVKEIVQDTLQ